MEISIDELAKALGETLTEYGKDVLDVIDKAGDEASKNAVKKLKETSPKRTGKYAKSWKYKRFNNFGEAKEYKIYAEAPHYRLTHLLEYGRMTRNGKRTKRMTHIAPVEKEAIKEYTENIERGIENI